MVNTVNTSNDATGTRMPAGSKNKLALKTEDFIKMMVTQLQQQDPMEPAKNEALLAQMSQIGQLQSSTQLQESLQGIVQQNQIGAAAGLIGKGVKGLAADDSEVSGTVTSVRVTSDGANLELDNGKTLSLSRVTTISPTAPAAPACPAAAA
jgi:flagellar basal-body rod modification protein FlgD